MPNIKSAKKRMRTSAAAGMGNKMTRTRVTTTRRELFETITDGNKDASMKAFAAYASALDKAAKRGSIKKNNADRRKARAARRINRAFAA